MNSETVTYCDQTVTCSFGVELIPKEIRKFIGNRNIKTNIEYKHTIH